MNDEPRTDLHLLQEYLDGRLSSEQRAAFEARLEREPALRVDLESALELRTVLGEEGPELSPGFYTRARARFDESRRQQQRWSFRLISWETAGLAAAAALATALFVPRLMQQGVPADLGAVATEKQQTVVLDATKDQEPAFAPEPAEERAHGESEGLEEALMGEKNRATLPATPKAEREKKGPRKIVDAPGRVAQEPVGFADAESEQSEMPGKQAPPPEPSSEKGDRSARRDQDPGPSTKGSVAGTTQHKRIARDDDAFHAAAPAAGGRVPPADLLSESVAAPDAKSEDAAASSARGTSVAVAAKESRPVVVELPDGLLDRGELRSVERVEEWLAYLGGPQGKALEMLGAPAANRRLILIGPRNGLACDALTVTSDGRAYRIEAASSPGDREAGGGCALVLPLDERTVSIAGPR